MKNIKRYIALLLIAALLLTALAGCKKEKTNAPSSEPTESSAPTEPTESSEPTESTAPKAEAGYGNNDVTALSDYAIHTAEPGDTVMSAVVAVNAEGEPVLTNSILQVCYWIEFYGFMSSYGAYAQYLGLDYTQPLASQSCAEDRTWEQYFLEATAQHISENYALAQAAYAEGYTLSEEDEKTIADIADPDGDFAAEIAEAGYESSEAYLKENFGDGVSMEDYQTYLRMLYAAMDHQGQIKQEIESGLTDAEVEAYYDENAESYAQNRVLKQNNVSARHILIAPEGEKDATLNDWTEEQWSAAEQKANEVYALWQQNPTVENFAALVPEYSADPGSLETGGLYENFATNAMVTEFSDWCFDPARVPGDTGIVKTVHGYHIIYFVEQTETRGWFDTAKSDAAAERIAAQVEELVETYPIKFDYTLVRVFDMLTKMMENSAPQG